MSRTITAAISALLLTLAAGASFAEVTRVNVSDTAAGICFDTCMKGPKVGNESFADKADRCTEKCEKKAVSPDGLMDPAVVLADAAPLLCPGS